MQEQSVTIKGPILFSWIMPLLREYDIPEIVARHILSKHSLKCSKSIDGKTRENNDLRNNMREF